MFCGQKKHTFRKLVQLQFIAHIVLKEHSGRYFGMRNIVPTTTRRVTQLTEDFISFNYIQSCSLTHYLGLNQQVLKTTTHPKLDDMKHISKPYNIYLQ